MSNPQGSDKKADFKPERYKYILQQLNALNENAHKYLTLYQTLATAIIGGSVLVFDAEDMIQRAETMATAR